MIAAQQFSISGLRVFPAHILRALVLFAPFSSAGAQDPPLESLGQGGEALLLTIGPGDRPWELFGHGALLIRDTASGVDIAYNFGLFDQQDMVLDFALGEMNYLGAALRAAPLLESYRRANRSIWAQKLLLDPRGTRRMIELLESQVSPENRSYRYDYYLNNCSTRLRDILDAALDGALREATEDQPSGRSWRSETLRLASASPAIHLGLLLAMGWRTNQETTLWEDMWVPMRLRDRLSTLVVEDETGRRRPVAAPAELWFQADRPPEAPRAPQTKTAAVFLALGAFYAALLYAAKRRSARNRRLAGKTLSALLLAWGAFSLFLFLIMALVHATPHRFAHWNPNLLLFTPLALWIAVRARAATRGKARGIPLLVRATPALAWAVAFVLVLYQGVPASLAPSLLLTLPVNLILIFVAPFETLRGPNGISRTPAGQTR